MKEKYHTNLCKDVIHFASLQHINNYLVNEEFIESFEKNKWLLRIALNFLRIHKSKLLGGYIENHMRDKLWVHRYLELFNDLKSGSGQYIFVWEYYANLLENKYDFEARKNFLEYFTRQYMSVNMHSYIVAEVFRPIFNILVEVIERFLRKKGYEEEEVSDIVYLFTVFLQMDLRVCILMIEENIKRIVEERKTSIRDRLFYLASVAQSDKIQNKFGALLYDFREILTAIKRDDCKKAKRYLEIWNEERLNELDKLTLNLSRQFYSHREKRTLVSHFVFVIEHIFRNSGLKFIFTNKEEFGECQILAEEFSILEVFYPIFENAINAKADTIEFSLSLKDDIIKIAVSNNGIPMSHFEREHCFERYFSGWTPRREGLGLFLSLQELRRLGGNLYLDTKTEKTTFIVEFKLFR